MSSFAGPASVSGDIVRSPVPVRLSGSRTDMGPGWGTGSGLTIWTSRYDHTGTIRRVRHSRKLQRRGGPARAQQRATVQDAVRAELFRRIRSTATSASRTRNRPARVSHPRACTWSLHHKARLCFRLFSCEGCPLALLSSCEGCPLALPGLKAPSTRTRAKSCAIIAAPGEICGLARISHQQMEWDLDLSYNVS